MNEVPFLAELAVVSAFAVGIAVLLRRLDLPVVSLLLLAGALVGPHALALVNDLKRIEAVADVGVVLLLFTIGLEFSLTRLLQFGARVLAVGALQIAITLGLVVVVMAIGGASLARGFFFGCLATLASTAIALRSLRDRNEVDAPHGRLIVGTLILQDLAVVPMMLILPTLAGESGGTPALDGIVVLAKAALTVAATFVGARIVVPRLLGLVDRARSRELFLLSVLALCIGTAWLTSLTGLSVALGAFLAGMILADSVYAHRAITDIVPFRDVLTSFFFMSLGMLLDWRVLFDEPIAVGIVFLGLIAVRFLSGSLAALAARSPLRVAVLTGIALAPFSEFGFVLAQAGGRLGLLTASEMRIVLAAAILTMVIAPLLTKAAPAISRSIGRWDWIDRALRPSDLANGEPEVALAGHVVIAGYGVAGQVLASALRASDVPHVVVELNADTVRAARLSGVTAVYGDVTRPDALVHARLVEAKALVLLVNDPEAAERAIAAAKQIAPRTAVFVRTHYSRAAARLASLGASSVVVEEVEAGIEMLALTLRHLGTARNVLMEHVDAARAQTQTSMRDQTLPRRRLGTVAELDLLKVETFLVRDGAHAAARSAIEMGVRARSGALVVAVHRDGTLIEQADPSKPFQIGDLLFLVGSRPTLARAMVLLESGSVEPAAPKV